MPSRARNLESELDSLINNETKILNLQASAKEKYQRIESQVFSGKLPPDAPEYSALSIELSSYERSLEGFKNQKKYLIESIEEAKTAEAEREWIKQTVSLSDEGKQAFQEYQAFLNSFSAMLIEQAGLYNQHQREFYRIRQATNSAFNKKDGRISSLSFTLNPEVRAYVEHLFAELEKNGADVSYIRSEEILGHNAALSDEHNSAKIVAPKFFLQMLSMAKTLATEESRAERSEIEKQEDAARQAIAKREKQPKQTFMNSVPRLITRALGGLKD